MPRSRATARKAGTAFETIIVKYLAERLDDDRIERRARNGAKDRGDVSGVRTPHGKRVVIEAKCTAKVNLGSWASEAEIERNHDDALVGMVVHKRHGKGHARDQWVTMTLADLAALLTGEREAA